jgi:hypothetical protein
MGMFSPEATTKSFNIMESIQLVTVRACNPHARLHDGGMYFILYIEQSG